MAIKQCSQCGKDFDAPRRSQKYCSDNCRRRVKYEYDRAWLGRNPQKAAAYSREWYAKNSEQVLEDKRDDYRRKAMTAIKAERDEKGKN